MQRTLRRVLAGTMALLVSVNTVNLHVFAKEVYSTGSLQEESADDGGITSPENVEEGSVSSSDTDREAANEESV